MPPIDLGPRTFPLRKMSDHRVQFAPCGLRHSTSSVNRLRHNHTESFLPLRDAGPEPSPFAPRECGLAIDVARRDRRLKLPEFC